MPSPGPVRLRDRKWNGSALVSVLWAVAMLALLAASASFNVTLDLRVTRNLTDEMKASCIAEAGVALAISVLAADGQELDSPSDDWYDNCDAFSGIAVGEGECDIIRPSLDPLKPVAFGIEDEESKLNLNTATRDMLLAIPGMTEEMADAIVDWRDEDSTPEPLGAERSYYASLPQPYLPRDGPLETLHELLLVRGIRPVDLSGEDTNDNGLLDANEDDGDLRPPADNADGALDRGLGRFLTPYSFAWNRDAAGNARVCLNTATEAELAAVSGISATAVKAIVAHRGKSKFTNIAELLDVTLPSEAEGGRPKPTEPTPGTTPQQKSEGREPVAGNGRPAASGSLLPATGGPPKPDAEGGVSEGTLAPATERDEGRGTRPTGVGRSAAEETPSLPPGVAAPQAEPQKAFTVEGLKAISDRVTVSEEARLAGQINVNTAPREVLRAVPGFGEAIVESLLAARSASPFGDIGELLDVSGISPEVFRQACPHLCVRSVHFRIRSLGRLPGTRVQKQVDCVVRRSKDDVEVVYWREGSER